LLLLSLYIDQKIHEDLQYLHVNVDPRLPWDELSGYREFFDQCTNLKALELRSVFRNKYFGVESLSKLCATDQQKWQEIFSYFQKFHHSCRLL
jgi:hypothetical protein